MPRFNNGEKIENKSNIVLCKAKFCYQIRHGKEYNSAQSLDIQGVYTL